MSDLRATAKLAADARSRFRLSMDLVLSRFIGLVPRALRDRVREVRLRRDIKIRYRLNKGDLHSIREIWLTTLVSSNGFKYIPAHSFSPENMDFFTRVNT